MNGANAGGVIALVMAIALGGGCRCTSFPSDLADDRCDDPAVVCPAGRVCRALSTGERFCVVASPDADGGGDSGTDAASDAGDAEAGQPADSGCACDDGVPCNGLETCQPGGGCAPGTPVDCTFLDTACILGTCNATTGACLSVPRPDGTPCDDGLFCSDPDACDGGACTGPARAACSVSGNVCADGGCDETLDTCTGTPLADGTACDDGLYCTYPDACALGACAGATRTCPVTGDPQCNVGTCVEATDSCTDAIANEAGACDDGDPGTMGEICAGGVCAP